MEFGLATLSLCFILVVLEGQMKGVRDTVKYPHCLRSSLFDWCLHAVMYTTLKRWSVSNQHRDEQLDEQLKHWRDPVKHYIARFGTSHTIHDDFIIS